MLGFRVRLALLGSGMGGADAQGVQMSYIYTRTHSTRNRYTGYKPFQPALTDWKRGGRRR